MVHWGSSSRLTRPVLRQKTDLFPSRYFLLPLLRHQQQWQPWAKQKNLPAEDVLALTLLTDTGDHMIEVGSRGKRIVRPCKSSRARNLDRRRFYFIPWPP